MNYRLRPRGGVAKEGGVCLAVMAASDAWIYKFRHCPVTRVELFCVTEGDSPNKDL